LLGRLAVNAEGRPIYLSKMTREGTAKIRNLAPEYAKWRSFVESQGAKIVCDESLAEDEEIVFMLSCD
jgi:hypothetical protein